MADPVSIACCSVLLTLLAETEKRGYGEVGRKLKRLEAKLRTMDGRTIAARNIKAKIEALKNAIDLPKKLLGDIDDLSSLIE